MKSIIYRGNTPFMTAFMSEAMAHTNTLTFTTREEYLAWVKNWKEEYKLLEKERRIYKLCRRREQSRFDKPDANTRADYYQRRLDSLPDSTETDRVRYKEIRDRLGKSFSFPTWIMSYPDTYWFLIALLIERKAGKLRAKWQMEANK